MRKAVLVVLIILFLLPGVAAESWVTGWLKLGDVIQYGHDRLLLKDVSFSDGSLMVYFGNDTLSDSEVVSIGGGVKWGDRYFYLYRTIAAGEVSYFNVSYLFPYLLEGQKLYVGDYEIYLKSVEENKAVLVLSKGNTSKELKYSGGWISFDNLRISLAPMPVLFDGYLHNGVGVPVWKWRIRFDGYNITSSNGTLYAMVMLNVNNKEYVVKTGNILQIGPLTLKIGNLIGSEFLKVTAVLRGAEIHVRVLPTYEGWVKEGKTEKIPPYLLRIEGVGNDGAYVSIMNSCGRLLRTGYVTTGTFAQGVYYGGLMIGAVGVREVDGSKEVRLIEFLNPNEIPRARNLAFLNVTLDAPSNAVQYTPFWINVTIRNSGTTDLGYLEIIPRISDDFILSGSYPHYLDVLKKGQKVTFSLKVLPKKSGELELGDILVVAHVPYELSCYGLGEVNFTSEKKMVDVKPAIIRYRISLNAYNGTVGRPIPVNITIFNTGNTNVSFALTVALPSEFAVEGNNFTLYDKWLYHEDTLAPNESKTYTIFVVPLTSGKYKILAGVQAYGKTFYNSTVITVSEAQTPRTQTSNTTGNSASTSRVVTYTQKVPVNCTETCTTSNTTCEKTSTKTTILHLGGAFMAGIVFILGLAWVAAMFEGEEEEEEEE
ncbi:hypothetical protein [Thermococcus sp.]